MSRVSAGTQTTLRWATAGDALTLDPHAQNEGLTNSVNAHIYERLTARDANLNLVPSLATGWEKVDALTWRFKLRRGVHFHDGRALLVEDVVFSVQRAQDARSAIAQYARALGQVRRVDDRTLEFKLQHPNPVFLDHVDAVFIMSRAWCEERRAQKPMGFSQRDENPAAYVTNGTGPYELSAREPDVRTVLKRFSGYWQDLTNAPSEVVHIPLNSPSARTAALLAGDIDLVTDPGPQDIARLNKSPHVQLQSKVEHRVVFLGFDQWRSKMVSAGAETTNPFLQQKVRLAVAHAVDTQALQRHVMQGLSSPAWCLVPTPAACADAGLDERRPVHELSVAKRLLAEAGYPQGFSVTLDCPNNRYNNDLALCIAIAGMLAKVNIIVAVNAMPKAVFFPKLERLESHFYLMGWGGAEIDPQPTMDPLMHSWAPNQAKGDDNYGRFQDTKLDDLIDLAGTETDEQQRATLIKQALTLHANEVYHIPLHRQMVTWAMRSNVDASPSANNHMRAWLVRMR